MQDDMTDEEAIAITRTMILRGIPTPETPEALSTAGVARLHQFEAPSYAKRLEEIGVGFALQGRLAIADPTLADLVLNELGLLTSTDLALTLAYTSFGVITVATKAGHEIVIDPVMEEISIYEGLPDEAPWLEMNLASSIETIAEQVGGPDMLIGLDGKDLHSKAEQRLGKLSYGESYMLRSNDESESRLSAQEVEVGNVVAYILRAHASHPFEINRFPFAAPEAGDEESWGED